MPRIQNPPGQGFVGVKQLAQAELSLTLLTVAFSLGACQDDTLL